MVEDAIANHQAPGAVVIVGHNGRVVYRKAFGKKSLEPKQEPMTADTVFDIASLTKIVATTTSAMVLYDQSKFRLNDPVSHYLPQFTGGGKEDVTIRQLMTHYSGLPPDLTLEPYWEGKEQAVERIWVEKLATPPGAKFTYSDINFETLGLLIEKLSGMPLELFAEKNVFQPLGMIHTSFRPLATPPGFQNATHSLEMIAPTEYDARTGQILHGVVHDPTARRMGGVAGHAGLFTTADDLAIYAQAILDILRTGTTAKGVKLFSKLTAEKMTTPQTPPTSTNVRGLGWDIDTPFSSDRGELLPVGSFGHTGFTGTSIHIDPYTQTYLIILTNAVHPHVGPAVSSLRARAADAVAQVFGEKITAAQKQDQFRITGYNEAEASAHRPFSRNGDVLTGIDVLEARNFEGIAGTAAHPRRIGLLTNQVGVDGKGQRTVDVLARAPGIKLTALFSPEHGAMGMMDTTDVDNSKDAATGLPIYSVYGDTAAKRHPPLDVLKQLDAVVIDLQDAGVRFWTYETTMAYFLEGAVQAGIEVIVLDRPNPIALPYVQGPLADDDKESFVSYHTLPVRHGMTMGELAKLFNSERQINAKLTIVPMQGYVPGDWYDSTGLTWINPSPNLRDLAQATLYPGVALIEGTNVSVGRGTDTPFEVVGAPWILHRERELAAYLNRQMVSGVRFVPIAFTPNSGTFANQKCGGVNIVLIDRYQLDSPLVGIELASALHKLFGEQFHLEKMDKLLANKATLDALRAGTDPHVIADQWRDGIDQFKIRRKPFELYTPVELKAK
ncbi:MAG: exo-beta-N-acetylmuramidase NamZ domain-containing protein [Acidobacteriaceae bacterium]